MKELKVIKPGSHVRNPKGNPNIGNIVSGGPKTDIGKLKGCIMAGLMKNGAHSKLLKKIRNCDVCPLKAKVEERMTREGPVDVAIPARCQFYKPGNSCVIDPREHIKKLRTYWAIGNKLDTMALQESLTYQILEDAEIAREVETIEHGKPGFYANKHTELAMKNMESVNKLKYGEKHQNTNINVNLNEVIQNAYRKRKEAEETEEK